MVIVLVFVAHFLQILVKRDEVCSHATMFLPSTWFNVANVLYVCLFAHTMQMWFIFGCLCVLMCIICQRRALMLLAMHAAVDCRNWVFCRLHLSVIILMRALPQNRRAPCIDLLWRRVCAEMMPHETSKPRSQMNHQSGSTSKLQMSTLGTPSGEWNYDERKSFLRWRDVCFVQHQNIWELKSFHW